MYESGSRFVWFCNGQFWGGHNFVERLYGEFRGAGQARVTQLVVERLVPPAAVNWRSSQLLQRQLWQQLAATLCGREELAEHLMSGAEIFPAACASVARTCFLQHVGCSDRLACRLLGS